MKKNKELSPGWALGYLDLLVKRRSSSARVNMGKECFLKISWFLILFFFFKILYKCLRQAQMLLNIAQDVPVNPP